MQPMLETSRLYIKPLTYSQLLQYIKNDNSLEAELKLLPSARVISPELMEALKQTIIPNVVYAISRFDKNYLFSTLWTMISKEGNKMIGDLCFVGDPDEKGEIEIGYGTYELHRNNGLMTEAVGAIIEWAKSHPLVKAIIASTDKINIASSKVLEKNHFIKSGETKDQYQWKLILKHDSDMEIDLQPELSNEIVRIRPLRAEDFESLFSVACDPLLWEQHPNKDRYKKEVFETFFKGALESKGAFIVFDANSGQVIGSSRYYDYDKENKSIAYRIYLSGAGSLGNHV
jgi:RimJ/RimL family protein N-acetyltransferase